MIVWAATVRNKTEPEYTFTSDGLSFDPSQLLLPTPHPVGPFLNLYVYYLSVGLCLLTIFVS
jgi:hypothetical protein